MGFARYLLLLIVLSGLAVPGGSAIAASARPIPEPLRNWVDWVRDSSPCPLVTGEKSQRKLCAWAHPLTLEHSTGQPGTRFRQQWDVYSSGWIPLPGDSETWPVDVRVDGRPAVVIARQHRPFVRVDSGSVTITGLLAGHDGRRAIELPGEVALVSYRLDGRERPLFLDAGGVLRFSPQRVADRVRPAAERDSLTLKVFRRFRDDVPTEITTLLRLVVSGREREVRFGRVTLPGAIPIRLQGPLRASIDEDGRLTAIVRPGAWELTVTAYYPRDRERWLRGDAGADFWPHNEYWFFQREPALYATELSGSPAVDPKSIDAPAPWSSLAAWRVESGGGLTVKRLSRGTRATGETRAGIERDLWISFDGSEMFLRDRVRGEARPYSSLVVADPAVQPRAIYLDGQPQVMVKTGEGIGVSLRRKRLDATVLGEIGADGGFATPSNPYAGLRAESITARLHLPPGWRLIATGSGVTADSWLSRWSLYLVFLLLIVSIAFGRVLGWGWGLFAAVTLGITFHEAQTPVLLWLLVLGLIAVLREGLGNHPRLTAFLRRLKTAALLAIGLMVIAYAIVHLRDALHPQLGWPLETPSPTVVADKAMVASEPVPMRLEKAMPRRLDSAGAVVSDTPLAGAPRKKFQQENEIRSTVGVPRWQGRVNRLQWDDAALQRRQPVDLLLMTPRLNLLFGFASSLMLLLLFLAVAGIEPRKLLRGLRPAARALLLPLAALSLHGVLPSTAEAAEFPPEYLLRELAAEVNRPPDCLPDCASLDRLHLSLDRAGRLTLRFRVDVVDEVALPLLESPRGGVDFQALLLAANGDGAHDLPLKRDGKRLLALLPPGSHEIVLQGLVSAPSLQLGLPLTVRRYGESVDGWVGSHVRDRHGWQALSFRRAPKAVGNGAPTEPASLPRSRLPAFFDVTREFVLGDGFYLDTEVRRLSPADGVATALIPAWPREVIVEANDRIRRDGDAIRVVFNAGETRLHFRSSLQFSDDELKDYRGGVLRRIELPPAAEAQRTRWRFDYASQWRLGVEGLPVIYRQLPGGENVKSLRPWPGERAVLLVSRVEPVPGKTVAVQRFDLSLSPRSSPGGALELVARIETTRAQTLTLDIDGATIREVTVNGRRINNEAASTVRIPLDVGTARVAIAGELGTALTARYREPAIALTTRDGAAVAIYNATTEIHMPRDRWVWHAGGRGVGPDFLFWSILPVLILLALALHRARLGQLGGLGWLLVMIGFTQANSFGLHVGMGMAALFISWLYLLRRREALAPFSMSPLAFDAFQALLLVMTALALASMADGLFNGLLGHPKMQVAGNGSNAWLLRWFSDRGMPRAAVASLPMLYYRIAILLWAIWLSFVVLRWIKYAWQAFSRETLWRPLAARAAGGDGAAAGESDEKRGNRGLWWLAALALVIFLVLLAIGF